MNRQGLEHIVRAVAAITNRYEIVIVGSQSILGACPNAPEVLLRSMEADVFPLDYSPELADLIDGSIGEGSPFQDVYGYYAKGVGPQTPILPAGRKERLVRIRNENTDLKVGYCLEPHDLAASKLAAGREKDFEFVDVMLEHRIVQAPTLNERLDLLPIAPALRTRLHDWVHAHAKP